MIRIAELKDAPSIYELLKQVAKVHRDLYPEYFGNVESKYDLEAVEALIQDNTKILRVYESESGVLGYILGWFTNPHTFFVDDLCVDEAARGKHVGQKLLNAVETDPQVKEVQLNVWTKNIQALTFYENNGYDVLKYVMKKTTDA